MFVACSTLCFARHPLERVLRVMAEMEFTKFEVVIDEQGPHLKPSEVAADVGAAAQQLRIGPTLAPAAITANIVAPAEEVFQKQLKALCHLARLSHVSVITIPASPAGVGLDAEVVRLKKLVHLAEKEGVILSVATRTGTVTEHPDAAVALCQRVPGLGLTLDPSHYVTGPHQGKSYDLVFPYVRNVQLRDSGKDPEQFQVRIGQGQIEYGRIITQLNRFHYNRVLTVAIADIPDAPYDIEQEVRKLKFLLESLI